MIDYEVLCRTIEDWRAGRRPSIDFSAAPAEGVMEYGDADVAYADDDGGQYVEGQGYGGEYQDAQGYEGEYQDPNQQAYAEGQGYEGEYQDPNQAYAEGQGYEGEYQDAASPVHEGGYDNLEADDATQAYMPAYEGDAGAPQAEVSSGGTAPVELGDVEDDEELLVEDDDEEPAG